jgi:DNA-directed RNA polymerase subunit RPC12/RpoP
MVYKCVDCGANAEIYDDNECPFCLLCLNVRDRKSRMQDAAIRDRVQSTREEYNRALKDLRAAHALLGDLDPGHPDGTASLRKANARITKAREAYEEALNALICNSRRSVNAPRKSPQKPSSLTV